MVRKTDRSQLERTLQIRNRIRSCPQHCHTKSFRDLVHPNPRSNEGFVRSKVSSTLTNDWNPCYAWPSEKHILQKRFQGDGKAFWREHGPKSSTKLRTAPQITVDPLGVHRCGLLNPTPCVAKSSSTWPSAYFLKHVRHPVSCFRELP